MRNLAALAILTAVALPALADMENEVRCREIGFSKSVEVQDHQAFAAFIDPDARFVGNKVDRSREAIAEAWAVFFTGDLPEDRFQVIYRMGTRRDPQRYRADVELCADGMDDEPWVETIDAGFARMDIGARDAYLDDVG